MTLYLFDWFFNYEDYFPFAEVLGLALLSRGTLTQRMKGQATRTNFTVKLPVWGIQKYLKVNQINWKVSSLDSNANVVELSLRLEAVLGLRCQRERGIMDKELNEKLFPQVVMWITIVEVHCRPRAISTLCYGHVAKYVSIDIFQTYRCHSEYVGHTKISRGKKGFLKST